MRHWRRVLQALPVIRTHTVAPGETVMAGGAVEVLPDTTVARRTSESRRVGASLDDGSEGDHVRIITPPDAIGPAPTRATRAQAITEILGSAAAQVLAAETAIGDLYMLLEFIRVTRVRQELDRSAA